MTDRFKIVRIRARNVPHTRTQALIYIDDDAFLAALSRFRKATVSRADVPRCHTVET